YATYSHNASLPARPVKHLLTPGANPCRPLKVRDLLHTTPTPAPYLKIGVRFAAAAIRRAVTAGAGVEVLESLGSYLGTLRGMQRRLERKIQQLGGLGEVRSALFTPTFSSLRRTLFQEAEQPRAAASPFHEALAYVDEDAEEEKRFLQREDACAGRAELQSLAGRPRAHEARSSSSGSAHQPMPHITELSEDLPAPAVPVLTDSEALVAWVLRPGRAAAKDGAGADGEADQASQASPSAEEDLRASGGDPAARAGGCAAVVASWRRRQLSSSKVVLEALQQRRMGVAVAFLHGRSAGGGLQLARQHGRAQAQGLLGAGRLEEAVGLLEALGEDIDLTLRRLLLGALRRGLRGTVAAALEARGKLDSELRTALEEVTGLEALFPSESFCVTRSQLAKHRHAHQDSSVQERSQVAEGRSERTLTSNEKSEGERTASSVHPSTSDQAQAGGARGASSLWRRARDGHWTPGSPQRRGRSKPALLQEDAGEEASRGEPQAAPQEVTGSADVPRAGAASEAVSSSLLQCGEVDGVVANGWLTTVQPWVDQEVEAAVAEEWLAREAAAGGAPPDPEVWERGYLSVAPAWVRGWDTLTKDRILVERAGVWVEGAGVVAKLQHAAAAHEWPTLRHLVESLPEAHAHRPGSICLDLPVQQDVVGGAGAAEEDGEAEVMLAVADQIPAELRHDLAPLCSTLMWRLLEGVFLAHGAFLRSHWASTAEFLALLAQGGHVLGAHGGDTALVHTPDSPGAPGRWLMPDVVAAHCIKVQAPNQFELFLRRSGEWGMSEGERREVLHRMRASMLEVAQRRGCHWAEWLIQWELGGWSALPQATIANARHVVTLAGDEAMRYGCVVAILETLRSGYYPPWLHRHEWAPHSS
ncbi:hypothetical protein CYMTET_33867, partial [Cymbomonas tetramitiformis]